MGEAPAAAAATPKLLELDSEDVKAVRSFLPGKVLGRTAALLALGVLMLGFAGSLDLAIEKFLGFPLEPPWHKYALLIGLPVLIVGAQIAVEWQAERRRRKAQALAVKIDTAQEGYFRIGPYLDTAQDRAKFDRADKAHEKILDWIKRAELVPLYLTGDSGSGKSSVLNAYALPELRQAGWTIVEARAWQDPEAALRDAVLKLAGERKWKLSDAANLRALIETLARRADEKVLLVLDQFEEFVILAGPERQKAFAALIADLRAKPIKGLKLLLVLRSDYTAGLDDLGLPPFRQGENWRETGRFTIAAGTRFMARSGLALQPEALDRLATSAAELDDSPGMIRPITLNVIGHVLTEGRASAPSLDAGRLVRHYIEQSVEQPAIRQFAPRVLKELVTEQGTKRPRSEADLVAETGLRPGEVRAVMNGLWTAALARPLDAAQGVWELSHDFVARAVARHLGRRRLDWSGLVRGYAAPALFGLMAAAVAGVVLWNAGADDRLRAQLADYGIELSSNGLEAAAGPRFKSENWARVCEILSREAELQTLNLSLTQVDDIAPLTDLRALEQLNLSGTLVADVAPLKELTALQLLDLSETQVLDIAPLKHLNALRQLNLSGTQVTDVASLRGMKALEQLDLANTKIANIVPLKDLRTLEQFNLSGTLVADVAPLKDLTALQSLSLSSTQIADISPLKDLRALKTLNLVSTPLTDIAPLKDLRALKTLNLAYTPLANIAPLGALTALQILSLSHSQVADIAPLNDLRALEQLDLSDTQVAGIAPLKDLKALQSLNLSRTQVADIVPLRELTTLRSLSLDNTPAGDFTPLQDLPMLKKISGPTEEAMVTLNAYRAQKGLPAIALK